MKIKHILLATALATLTNSVYAESKVYKCKNAQGGMSYQGSPCAQNTQPVSSWSAKKNVERTMVLTPKDNGHYFLDSQINNQSLTFLIDTGASSVALPKSLADVAHLNCKSTIMVSTANGNVQACTTTITTLTFGPFTLHDVEATINPTLDQPLLGMNVLKQFQISQENGEMRITAR